MSQKPSRKQYFRVCLVFSILFGLVFEISPLGQNLIYTNGFDSAVGLEWSSNARKRAMTPIRQNYFIGRFASEAALLTLTNLPPHEYLTLEYDVYIIDAWDGNGGPDIFTVREPGATILLRTSFCTHSLTNNDNRTQAFPGSFSYDSFKYGTGANLINSLGYTNWVSRFEIATTGTIETNGVFTYWKPSNGIVKEAIFDSVYRIRHVFPHVSDVAKIQFSMVSPENNTNDESWGLDNVVITAYVKPNIEAPTILQHPKSSINKIGDALVLSVAADGFRPFYYQWTRFGTKITSATNATLRIANLSKETAGEYRVIISNLGGETLSSSANVSLLTDDTDSDGLTDLEEKTIGTNPNQMDTDGDGLSDFSEVRTHKSDPSNTDTDGDGYRDGIEVFSDGNPINSNTKPTGVLVVSSTNTATLTSSVSLEYYTLLGVKYQLEPSTDLLTWLPHGEVVEGTNRGRNINIIPINDSTQLWRLKIFQ